MSKIEFEKLESLGYRIKTPDPYVNGLLEEEDVSKLIKTILANRLTQADLKKYDTDIKSYIFNHLNFDKDLDKLKDVFKAANLIIKHLNNNSHIVVVSDFDADGVNSAAILYLIFKKIFMVNPDKLSVLVNKRRNGNGYNKTLMGRIKDLNESKKIDLIISADHGSTNNKQYKELKELGIELVITDHHQIPIDNYPDNADVFINTQRVDSEYFKDVSGCFVAFITCIATYKKMFKTDNFSAFNFILPYVGLTTITDVMSLKLPINREIVKAGINEMNSGRNPLWLMSKNILGLPGKINTKQLGFNIGPLINTANRLDVEDLAFKLLTSDSQTEVFNNGKELLQLNMLRKNVQKKIINKAKDDPELNKYKHSIVYTIESDFSISGIVAANLGESFKVPTVCFLKVDNVNYMVGSCRAIIKGLDLVKIFNNINNKDSSVFVEEDGKKLFGGHEGAAGCSVYCDKIELFKELFDKECSNYSDIIKDKKIIDIDCVMPDYKIGPGLIKEIDALAPYGKDWEEPVFLSILTIKKMFKMGPYVKIFFGTSAQNREISSIYYFKSESGLNQEQFLEEFQANDKVYVVYKVNIDSFNNTSSFNLDIVNIKKYED